VHSRKTLGKDLRKRRAKNAVENLDRKCSYEILSDLTTKILGKTDEIS